MLRTLVPAPLWMVWNTLLAMVPLARFLFAAGLVAVTGTLRLAAVGAKTALNSTAIP